MMQPMWRRRRRGRPEHHGPEWHEAMQAEPWASYAAWETDESGRRIMRPLSRREWEAQLNRARQQMQMHDAQPARARALVCEHNVKRGLELYRAELLSTMERCPHGRKHAPSCAQCTYEQAVAERRSAVGRSGEQLTRSTGSGAAAILRKRGLDV